MTNPNLRIINSDDEQSISIKEKIDKAKIHANIELETFKDLLDNFDKSTAELVLFKEISEELVQLYENYLVEVIDPIIRGKKTVVASPKFDELRTEMFKKLIKKYVD